MKKDLKCKCGKILGVKCLETQEINLSVKTVILNCGEKCIKLQCPNCNETYTEIGKVVK